MGYYVFGADESGHRYSQPSFGAVEPHHFEIEEGSDFVEQTITISRGWNWWSTYLDIDLEQLKVALGDKGLSVVTSDGAISYLPNYGWDGNLETFDPTKMYMLESSTELELVVRGTPIDPSTHPVTLIPGFNWIGYPLAQSMSLNQALSGLVPNNGDFIKSMTGIAMYSDGNWIGTFSKLEPGQGYIYKSTSTESKSFYFPVVLEKK